MTTPHQSRATIVRASVVSALLTVAAVLAFGMPSLASATDVAVNTSPDRVQEFTSAQNDPAGWPDCAGGTKVDLDGQNRFTYTLTSPASLLVIKAATWNFIWDNPTAGVYGVPTAPDGMVHAISHVIVCGATTPSSTSASGSATGTSASGSATGTSASGSATETSASGSATETTESGTSTATTSAAVGAPSASTTSAAAANGTLPRTGGDVMRIVGVALAAIALGAGLWFAGRRRGPRPSHL